MIPETIQTVSKSPGLCTCAAISAETMKMPEPIIEPQTIIVESKRPRPLTSSGCLSPLLAGDRDGSVTCSSPLLRLSRNVHTLPRDFQILPRTCRWIPGVIQITDDRDRVSAGAKNLCGGLYCDATDGYKGFSGEVASITNEVESDHGIGIL